MKIIAEVAVYSSVMQIPGRVQQNIKPRSAASRASLRREAQRWLIALLLVVAALVVAGAHELRLLGSGATALGLVSAAVTLLAAGALGVLSGTLLGRARLIGFVSTALAALAVLLPVQYPWLGALFPPLLAGIGYTIIYRLCKQELSEKTLTQLSGWLLALPAVLLMLMWVYFPAVYAFWISLYKDFNYLGTAKFIGFENYLIAFRDPLFLRALVNTGWYVVGTVPISIFLGVFVAILLNERIRGLSFYRLIYFLPYITALTAAAAVWSWIYNPSLGLLNWVLGLENFRWTSNPNGIFSLLLTPFGLELPTLLAGPSVALISIMIMSIWHFLGYNVVIFLAGLQNIPREYYEAARIDGANWWQQLRYLTWPLLSPTTFFVLIISLIGSLNVFTQILIMTPLGGVLNDTLSVVMYLYFKGFRDFDFGYASALAFILFVITLALTLLQRRLLNRQNKLGGTEL